MTEPPSATTTTTIGISATWTTLAGSHGKRNNTITTTSSKRKNRKNKINPENVQIIFDDPLPISYSQPEKVNGESKSSSTSESGDSDNMRISSCSDESSNSNSSRKSDNHSPAVVTTTVTSKKQPSVLVTFPKEERKSVSGKAAIKLVPIFIIYVIIMRCFVAEFFSKANKLTTGKIRVCLYAKEGTISFELKNKVFFRFCINE